MSHFYREKWRNLVEITLWDLSAGNLIWGPWVIYVQLAQLIRFKRLDHESLLPAAAALPMQRPPFFPPLLLGHSFGPQLTLPPLRAAFLWALACAVVSCLKPMENLLAYSPVLVTLFENYSSLRNSPACIVYTSNSLSFRNCACFG